MLRSKSGLAFFGHGFERESFAFAFLDGPWMLSYFSIGCGISRRSFSCCQRLNVEATMQVRFVCLWPCFVEEEFRFCFFGCSVDAFFLVFLFDVWIHAGALVSETSWKTCVYIHKSFALRNVLERLVSVFALRGMFDNVCILYCCLFSVMHF